MMRIGAQFKFAAAHKLPYYEGDCHRLHGHTYKVEVVLEGDIDCKVGSTSMGMVVDLREIKKVVNELVVEKFDHQYLNDIFVNPTVEVICATIVSTLHDKFKPAELVEVKVWESDSTFVQWIEKV